MKNTLLELSTNDNLTKGERYYVQTALKALPKDREPVEIKDETLKMFAFICNEVRTPAGSVETDTVRYAIWALGHFVKGDNKEAVYWALTSKRLAEENKEAVPYIVKALEKEVDFPKYITELKADSDKIERDNPEVFGPGAVHEKIIEREEEPEPVEPQVALF